MSGSHSMVAFIKCLQCTQLAVEVDCLLQDQSIYAKQSCCSHYGYSGDQVHGKGWRQLMTPACFIAGMVSCQIRVSCRQQSMCMALEEDICSVN